MGKKRGDQTVNTWAEGFGKESEFSKLNFWSTFLYGVWYSALLTFLRGPQWSPLHSLCCLESAFYSEAVWSLGSTWLVRVVVSPGGQPHLAQCERFNEKGTLGTQKPERQKQPWEQLERIRILPLLNVELNSTIQSSSSVLCLPLRSASSR